MRRRLSLQRLNRHRSSNVNGCGGSISCTTSFTAWACSIALTRFFEEVFDVFARPDTWMLYPETLKVLEDLKTQQYELGIISNFDSRLFVVLRGLGIAEYFQTVTISSLAHAAKPSGRIFTQALEKHAVEPEDAVHVGDSLDEDVKGAQQAGLTGNSCGTGVRQRDARRADDPYLGGTFIAPVTCRVGAGARLSPGPESSHPPTQSSAWNRD